MTTTAITSVAVAKAWLIERRELHQFAVPEVEDVLRFIIAQPYMRNIGMRASRAGLYRQAGRAGISTDVLDAALKALTDYKFICVHKEGEWLVRKPLTESDASALVTVLFAA